MPTEAHDTPLSSRSTSSAPRAVWLGGGLLSLVTAALAGGPLGRVVGYQVGGGNGKTAMTVLGAIGGGLAGNEVEKRARGETVFDVRVRMQDGSTRTFRRSQSLAVGTRVVVEGTALRIVRDAAGSDEPRTVRTSAPAGART